jgi:hypothetical protein
LADNYLLPAIREIITGHSLSQVHRKWGFVLSHFEKDASPTGAIAIVIDNMHSHLYAPKGGDAPRSKYGMVET